MDYLILISFGFLGADCQKRAKNTKNTLLTLFFIYWLIGEFLFH